MTEEMNLEIDGNITLTSDTPSEAAATQSEAEIMGTLDRMLRTVLIDVREERLGMEQALEKIYGDPNLREAMVLLLRELVARNRKREEFLSERKAAGLKLDPATAEAIYLSACVTDPYGVYHDPEDYCYGRVIFARAPGSKIWVSEYEIPTPILKAILARVANERMRRTVGASSSTVSSPE
jgi:hypothetical protein